MLDFLECKINKNYVTHKPNFEVFIYRIQKALFKKERKTGGKENKKM